MKNILLISTILWCLTIGQILATSNDVNIHIPTENLYFSKYDSIIINPHVVLPKDSLEINALLTSANAFLSLAQDNRQNPWILPNQIMETQLLIDEIHNIQKNEELSNDSFYKPHLINIIPLEEDKFALHISYTGILENLPVIRASFEIIAHKSDDKYLFSSPLRRNTRHWKRKKLNNQVFYAPFDLKTEKIDRFYDLTTLFDKKLNITDAKLAYFLCTNEMDPLRLFGVNYKSDYNGQQMNGTWETSTDDKSMYVMNASRFYEYPEHDLWHFRLSQVISRREVHRRVDCHIGTLYGGLWGLSWEELFPMFCKKYVTGEDIDWLGHKENKSHFITLGRRKNYSDDFVGALLVKEIEETIGWAGVWKLLMTKRTKEEEEYFSALEELIGISKENYNEEVTKLIQAEIKQLNL